MCDPGIANCDVECNIAIIDGRLTKVDWSRWENCHSISGSEGHCDEA